MRGVTPNKFFGGRKTTRKNKRHINRGQRVEVLWQSEQYGQRASSGYVVLHGKDGIALATTMFPLDSDLAKQSRNNRTGFLGPLSPNEDCTIILKDNIMSITALVRDENICHILSHPHK